ncbi:hypothetical protein KIPB_015909, partial [Kipferlia bialata]
FEFFARAIGEASSVILSLNGSAENFGESFTAYLQNIRTMTQRKVHKVQVAVVIHHLKALYEKTQTPEERTAETELEDLQSFS